MRCILCESDAMQGSNYCAAHEPVTKVMLEPDAKCAVCGYAPVAHTGPEMFCPIYATYRASTVKS